MADVRLTATDPTDSSVVPVACNAKGELLLEEPQVVVGPEGPQGPPGQNGQDGDPFSGNFAGDVTFGGSAVFGDDVVIHDVTVGRGPGEDGSNTVVGKGAFPINTTGRENTAIGQRSLENNMEGDLNTAVGTNALENIIDSGDNTAVGAFALATNSIGSYNTAIGRSAGFAIQGSNNTIIGAHPGEIYLNDTVIISAGLQERVRIDSDGIARFFGDVVITSRNKPWMLVEQNGLCHLVEQISATTADLVETAAAVEYPPLRDVFAELDAIEKALEEVMDKLRMAPPAGWEVWDGSSENS